MFPPMCPRPTNPIFIVVTSVAITSLLSIVTTSAPTIVPDRRVK